MFTKASLLEGPERRVVHSLKRDSILREAHASLERLGVDAIDLYQIHWPIPERGHRGGLGRLRRAEGARARPPHRRLELRRRPAARGSSRSRRSRRCSRSTRCVDARRRGRAPALRGAGGDRRDRLLADGLRAAQRRDDARADREPARGRLAQARRALQGAAAVPAPRARRAARAVAERHGTTPGAVAVAWTLRNPAVDGAIVGFRRPDQVDPIIAAAMTSSSTTRTSHGSKGGDNDGTAHDRGTSRATTRRHEPTSTATTTTCAC